VSDSQNYAENRTVGVSISANLDQDIHHNLDGNISGSFTVSLNKPNNKVIVSTTHPFGPITPGQSQSFHSTLHSGGAFPDQADLTITIYNNQSYGPSK
jgi:hypothetical protein